MAEDNVTETIAEPSANDEAVINVQKEESEQDTQQQVEETTGDNVVQPSTIEENRSEVTEEKEKADEPVKEDDLTEKDEAEKVSSPMEPDLSVSATEEEKERRTEEQPPADPSEDNGEKEESVIDDQHASPLEEGEPVDESQQETGEADVPQPSREDQVSQVDEHQDEQPKKETDGSAEQEVSMLQEIQEEDEDEHEEEEDQGSEEFAFDREEAIEKYKELTAEYEKLQAAHGQLQHKIAEFLARKKVEERVEPGRTVTDQEQRYRKCMKSLEELQMQASALRDECEQEKQTMNELCQFKDEQVQKAREEFVEFIHEKAVTAIHSRTGHRLTEKEVGQYMSQMEKKDQEVTQVRLKNIKLTNKIQKLESLIRQKEQLAEGLHMIDFEQLKISNVDLTEKIEERNEDILKLKCKVDSTIQILAHLKEKQQFMQAENKYKKEKLTEIDEIVAKKRNVLTRLKQARDAVRSDNLKLRQKGGLVGHKSLLRDFEEKIDESEVVSQQLLALQQRHSELLLQCSGLKGKIDQARAMDIPI